MAKKIFITISILIAIIVGVVLLRPKKIDNHQENLVPKNNIEIQEASLTVQLNEELLDVTANLIDAPTAYDLLKILTTQKNISLETKQFDFGLMLEAINNKINGEDNKYWLYYVNGEMPMVSLDKYELKAGDRVEIKFEASVF